MPTGRFFSAALVMPLLARRRAATETWLFMARAVHGGCDQNRFTEQGRLRVPLLCSGRGGRCNGHLYRGTRRANDSREAQNRLEQRRGTRKSVRPQTYADLGGDCSHQKEHWSAIRAGRSINLAADGKEAWLLSFCCAGNRGCSISPCLLRPIAAGHDRG